MGYIQEKDLIFGLDIGTRTVIGVVGYNKDNKFNVLATEIAEHEERAMQDGQIHDVQKVTSTIMKVKTNLENKLNTTLKEVALAAAGRALNTQIVHITHKMEDQQEITAADIFKLEMQGVDLAKEKQKQQFGMTSDDYYCVAHSVIHYFLNDYIVSNLEGHKAESIGAKILATFLPKVVIDSLYASTKRAGLEVAYLTLEPIAAINAVIPPNLRLLNLALVDIGAGTSDIAITKEESVVAYGMIPIAGDEITETIVHHYLVDFTTADKIKQCLESKESIEFMDILGMSQIVDAQSVKDAIQPAIDELSENIAQKILELNGGKAPSAVFCVGGGSQLPQLTKKIAAILKIPEQRVALRSAENIENLLDAVSISKGPDMITPFGICLTAMQKRYSQFTYVFVNQKRIELLNAKQLTVLDALLAAGVKHDELFPKRGEMLMFKLNGERIRIKGTKGEPAKILLNGHETHINEQINQDDAITVIEGVNGRDATALVSDYLSNANTAKVYVNNQMISLPVALANGKLVDSEYKIKESDQIEICTVDTLGDLINYLPLDIHNKIIKVNGKEVSLCYKLKNQDSIVAQPAYGDYDNNYKDSRKDIQMSHDLDTLVQSNKAINEENMVIIVNQKPVVMPKKEGNYMIVSVFDFIDFDLSTPKGSIQLVLNGKSAAFTDVIKDKDILEIYWKE